MKVEDSELLPDERVILSNPANAVTRLDEYGLGRFPADQLMRVMGFAGKEAIGGRLHLTSYRLLFKSHRVNRVTGSFSIYLPTITGLADRSRWLPRKVEVTTGNQVFDFGGCRRSSPPSGRSRRRSRPSRRASLRPRRRAGWGRTPRS
jgi:hypothetical protein